MGPTTRGDAHALECPLIPGSRNLSQVLSTARRAHVGTAFALWTLAPLLIGIYRITRREIAA